MWSYLGNGFQGAWAAALILFKLAPIWLPFVLLAGLWQQWMGWRRAKYITKQEPVLLEIRVPKEVSKSPAAMEIVLANAFYATGGEGNWYEKYWDGGVRPWFSLELVSLEGQVKFFIWTWKGSVKNIQNQIYAQYPTVEVTEVPDYTLAFAYDVDKADIYGAEFQLTKADPYPIKTYVDYGLDRDPKEEFKIDPITNLLEYLGGLGKGEQAWIQIIIRAHKKEDKKGGSFLSAIMPDKLEALFDIGKKAKEHFEPTDKWKDDVKSEIESIVKKRKIKGDDESKQINLTSVEKETIEALERSVTKVAFDAGIRALYLAETDYFNKSHKGALNGVLAQFSSQHLNGFKKRVGTGFDFWYEDPFGRRLAKMKRDFFEAYRLRSYFHPPHKKKPFILNTEELATMYHFPGGVAETPTFGRIESRKAEPPMNLPL